jgi:hypothetical protein
MERMLTTAMMTDREEGKSCRRFWRRGEARGVLVKRKVMAEMMARSIWREEQRGRRIWRWREVTTAADKGSKEEDDSRILKEKDELRDTDSSCLPMRDKQLRGVGRNPRE